jgi:hypothetical protein
MQKKRPVNKLLNPPGKHAVQHMADRWILQPVIDLRILKKGLGEQPS